MTNVVSAAVTRDASAKLNLYLHIKGRRADGYHLLESLIAFTDVGDVVTAENAPSLSLAIEGRFAAELAATAATDNLVIRAAKSLAAGHAKRANGAKIRLRKELPVASGIGGGSADAAATLLALRDLWRIDIDETALAELGAALGADVPVCLTGRPAFVSGIGDVVEPVPPLPPLGLVLVNPGVGLPTPSVYRAFAGGGAIVTTERPAPKGPWTDERHFLSAIAATANDLEAAAIELCPVIARALAALRSHRTCALARMSGSGATTFGLFSTLAEAETAARTLARAEPSWWVAPARFLAT